MKKTLMMMCAAVAVTSMATYTANAQMATVYMEKNNEVVLEQDEISAVEDTNLLSGNFKENSENEILMHDDIKNQDVRVNISEASIIIDATNRIPGNRFDIEKDSKVEVYSTAAMTMSIPPMTNAKAVIMNLKTDEAAPIYFEVDNIINNNDKTITLSDKSKTRVITVNTSTVISPYKTRNIIDMNDIAVGDKLVIWKKAPINDVQTMELPEKIEAENCIVIKEQTSLKLTCNVIL